MLVVENPSIPGNALRMSADNKFEGGLQHPDDAAGSSNAVGFPFARDVDHVGLALAVEVGQR